MSILRRGFHYYLWLYRAGVCGVRRSIFEGLDMGEHIGLQTSGPDCAAHRSVRAGAEWRTWPPAQCDDAYARQTGRRLVGPSPMDRGKLGSKYHIMIAGDGTPAVCLATAANVPDTRLFKRLFLAAFAIMARLCEVATFSSQTRVYLNDRSNYFARRRMEAYCFSVNHTIESCRTFIHKAIISRASGAKLSGGISWRNWHCGRARERIPS
jgi:hypothetical protein